jgi:pyruvate/2-oxoglutarate dehydrogenase complex dihydrolipoamide acyltransferase (E2) component
MSEPPSAPQLYDNGVVVKEFVPFNLQRKVAAHKTVESWHNVPHAGIMLELDVTELLVFVKKAKTMPEFKDVRITFNAVMLKLIAEALKKAPQLNAYVEYSNISGNGRMVHCEDINIAVPMFLPDGRTITPVIPQLQNKSLREICVEMDKMQNRVKNTNIEFLLFEAAWGDTMKRLRKGQLWTVLKRAFSNLFGKDAIKKPSKKELQEYEKIPPEDRVTAKELLSATVLLSNIGSAFQGLPCSVAMIEIIPPQSAVFGVASTRRTPVVKKNAQGEETIMIRDICPVTIMGDHRGNDFGPAVGALKKMIELCEHPEKMLE